MKECKQCKKLKPLSDFYKHPSCVDNHLNECKECTKENIQVVLFENIRRI